MSQKSKEIIVAAFLEIMQTSAYEDITISEILANTPLVRKTFYNNFKEKDDIVRYICHNLMAEYMTRLTSGAEFTLYNFARTFYVFGKEKREIFTLLFQNRIFHIFNEAFNNHMALVNSILPHNILNTVDDENLSFIFAFHAQGTLAMFELWVKSGFQKSVDNMATIYTSIVGDLQE
ncbi:TetR/AcrR family transcriptional regulator [Bengtsoniella intestinalis]|uniref:TetR/AcrR family transcriptional regulator n=1 Tax=Bengtsoniella intestinalis TaxID=3073143 RepID=UPI00391FBCDB